MGPDLPEIEWVWKCYIPRGLLTILGASQGSGKSFVGLDLGYRIIHNIGFPDGTPIVRPGANVIYVDAEAVPQIMRQRANHYGMDQTKIFPMLADEGEMIDLGMQKYQDRLIEMVAYLKPELIIIDSLSSVHTRGQNNVEDLRALVGFLIRLAGWANCGVLLIHHIRKPSMGSRMMNVDFGMEDLSGSGYITQQARVVMSLRVVQTGPEFNPNGPRELKVIKSNLGAYPKALGFTFKPVHPEGARLKWETEAPKEYRESTEADECAEWLEYLLKENPDGLRPKEIKKMAKEMGFSPSMIDRMRRKLSNYIVNTRGRQAPDNAWKWSVIPISPDEDGGEID
ncbi:MAG: AAA family ATPase [Anaerolineales bacterium]|nr:AAA family ATPase [Anaerolineales bacterium]